MKNGIFIPKRTLWLMAGGAIGALAVIGISKKFDKIKPAVIGAIKEGYAFKEWVTEKYEKTKEGIEDIAAEARHDHYKDLEATQETVKREKDIIEKLGTAVGKKVAQKRGKKKEE